METRKDDIASSPGVCVRMSTNNCINDIGIQIKPSIEESNKHLSCGSKNILEEKDFVCASNHVTRNGPNGMVNGVDAGKYDVPFCDSIESKFNVIKCSSPNEKCLCEEASDNKCKKSDANKKDVKFTLDCKKALQELILDKSQESYQNKSDSSISPGTNCSLPNDSLITSPYVSERFLDCQTLSLDSSIPENKTISTIDNDIVYVSYENEHQMPDIMRLIQKDLSEPYSIYTYRYFIHKWPQLCFLAMDGNKCVGAIVCKLDIHRKVIRRGYIAMLAVDEKYRKRKIGTNLVLKAIRAMVSDNADEIVLETEITNNSALCLYENLGFVRDKRLFRYYLNGVDALRLKLWLR